jgi:hypothetical protein
VATSIQSLKFEADNSQHKLKGAIMKKLQILFVAVTLVTSAAFAVIAAENGPAEIKLPASMGEIIFDHAGHQSRISECTSCHHQGEGTDCHSCHDAKPEVPSAKKALHNNCKDCHKEQSGPTKCKECHTGAKG